MECIILAGGMGTRLQTVVSDRPKCMAPVNNEPFLHYIFDYLEQYNCEKVILSLGYKHEFVLDWLATQHRRFSIEYVIENEPMGTGGGIQLALKKLEGENALILNGDTMFRVNLSELLNCHIAHRADTTLALKPMTDFERYGAVNVRLDGSINAFEEKKYRHRGLINGGVYVVNKKALETRNLPEKYSFEKDYLERFVHEGKIYGLVCDAYFIDIGIPSDYEQAQQDFKTLQ